MLIITTTSQGHPWEGLAFWLMDVCNYEACKLQHTSTLRGHALAQLYQMLFSVLEDLGERNSNRLPPKSQC